METLGPPMRTVAVDRGKDKYKKQLLKDHRKAHKSLPKLLVHELTNLQTRASIQRWNESEGPGGKFTGHGTMAAMEQTRHITTGLESREMVAETDHHMMCQSLQRP